MSESYPGDFDLEAFIRKAESFTEGVEEAQKAMASVVGRAQDEDNFVTVEYSAQGLSELLLHPKAMRLSSGELAELIKEMVAEATADYQRQIEQVMSDTYGEDNPMKLMTDPDAAMQQVNAAQAVYDRTFEDQMAELHRISRRLGL